MLKLLRNFALAGLLLAGCIKLLAWWAVGRDAERTVVALAPYAQIKYDGISAGLDGSVTLNKVSVDAGHHVYRADTLVFEAPSLFWLLGHAFFGGDGLPAQFGLSAEGLKLPPLPWLDPRVFDPNTFVPFIAAGCGDALHDADYQRMGAAVPPATHAHLDYRYDADQHTLSLLLNLKAPGFSQVDIETDVKKFDAAAIGNTAMWDKAHLDQVSATYTDQDFFAKRNQFCAQRSGGTPEQFVERHIAAVQDLLKQKRVEPSNEVVQLYRALLEHGGQASVLSLPSAGFVLAAVHGAPDELLRQLNVTARYKDKPPIMFRVAFAPAPEEPAAAPIEPPPTVAAAPASTASATPSPSSAPTPTNANPVPATPAPPATAATQVAANSAPSAAAKAPVQSPAPATPTPAPPVAASPAPTAPAVAVAPSPAPAAKTSETTTSTKTARDNLGLHNLDREEERLATVTPPLAPPAKREIRSALTPVAPLGPSAEAPPSGSLLSMVWKPSVFETLPESETEGRNYDLVDYARLGSLVGRYVQVITEGGKKIGGLVLGVDDTGVKLQVNREGGNITFVVARTRVQEVRLPHY